MKRAWIFGIALAAAVATAGEAPEPGDDRDDADAYTRKFEKVLDAAPGAVFALDHSFGDVTVTVWEQAKVSITAEIRVKARSREKAARYGEQIRIDVTPSPGRIAVKTVYPVKAGRNESLSFSVDYRITLPVRQAAELRNAFGGIEATGLQGTLTAGGKHGSVTVSRCAALARIENEFGSIRFEDVGGGEIAIENTNGEIRGANVRSAAGLKVRNRFGAVTLEKVTGGLSVKCANGAVTVEEAAGPVDIEDQFGAVRLTGSTHPVRIKSGNGRVEASSIAGGEIENSFGEVEVFGTTLESAGLKVTNANGAVIVRSVKGNASLSASFGRIEAADVTGNVTASAQNASVEIRDPGGAVEVEGSFGPVTVKGARADVRIRNQNGSIECGVLKAGKTVDLGSSFGMIRLSLPGDVSATVRAETMFGRIESDFPLKTAETATEVTAGGVLGGGGADITLSNQNGSIEIRKNRPGE